MKIGAGTSATLKFKILDADTQEVIDKNTEERPVTLLFGRKKLIPAFENNLMGLSAGDTFDFTIKAKDAYGEKDPYAVFDVPLDTFEVDGKIDQNILRVGNIIPMSDNEGREHQGRIIKIMENAVTMDFNHPLAGINLRFTGKIIEVKS